MILPFGEHKVLAMHVGIRSSHLCDLIAARKRPSARLAARLERATGVDLRVWLLGSHEEIKEKLREAYR